MTSRKFILYYCFFVCSWVFLWVLFLFVAETVLVLFFCERVVFLWNIQYSLQFQRYFYHNLIYCSIPNKLRCKHLSMQPEQTTFKILIAKFELEDLHALTPFFHMNTDWRVLILSLAFFTYFNLIFHDTRGGGVWESYRKTSCIFSFYIYFRRYVTFYLFLS